MGNWVEMCVPLTKSLILYQHTSISTFSFLHILPWLLLLGIWGHCLSSFPSTEKATFGAPCNLRIWLPFFFFPYIFVLYIAPMCISAYSSHSLCTSLSVLNSLLSKLNLWWYQINHIRKSGTHYYCPSPHTFISLYSHHFVNIYFKTSLINSCQNLKFCYAVPFLWILWLSAFHFSH